MGILLWIVFGLIAGFIADKIMKGGHGVVGDIVLGIVGALLGGWLSSALLNIPFTGFDIRSFVIAIVGACLLIGIVRAVTGRRRHA